VTLDGIHDRQRMDRVANGTHHHEADAVAFAEADHSRGIIVRSTFHFMGCIRARARPGSRVAR
jgi:sulfatase maturation enzyme AslB (radical SAM superfamily)